MAFQNKDEAIQRAISVFNWDMAFQNKDINDKIKIKRTVKTIRQSAFFQSLAKCLCRAATINHS